MDEELKELEKQYLESGLTLPSDDNIDIDALMKEVDPELTDKKAQALYDGLDEENTDNMDFDMNKIDQMLKELQTDGGRKKGDDLEGLGIESQNLLQELTQEGGLENNLPNNASAVVEEPSETVEKDTDKKESLKVEDQDLNLDAPVALAKVDSIEKALDESSPVKSSKIAFEEDIQELSLKSNSPDINTKVESRAERSKTDLASLGIQLSDDEEPFEDKLRKKSSITFEKKDSKNVEDVNISSAADALPSMRPRRPSFNDHWIEDIEKKIRFNEVSHIHKDMLIDESAVVTEAQQKYRGHQIRENLVKDKVKEFTFSQHSVSIYKMALETFEKQQRKEIKELKEKKESDFYSAIREASWSGGGQDSFSTDKGQALADTIEHNIIGNLTCFAFTPDRRSVAVLGTDQGQVLEVDLPVRKLRKHKLDSKIHSIDVSPDKEKFVAGLDSGEIYVKRTYGTWTSKRFKVDDKPLLFIKFYSHDTFVVATERSVFKIIVKDLKVMFDIAKFNLLPNMPERILHTSIFKSENTNRLVVASSNNLICYKVDSNSDVAKQEILVERPPYVSKNAVPSVAWLIPEKKISSASGLSANEEPNRYMLIFWDQFVLLVKEDPMLEENSSLVGMKQLSKKIIWGCVQRNRVICLIFEDFEVGLYSIQNLFVNLVSGGGFETTFKLTRSEYTKARPLFVGDDGNLCQSWSEAIKVYDNYIFFLKKDSIFSIYSLSLQELSKTYIEKGEWLPAFRLCVEVVEKKIRADESEQAIMKQEVCQLALNYVDRFLSKSSKVDNTHSQIARICIDSLLSTGNKPFLFSAILPRFDEIIFWKEIDSFVENGILDSLPLNTLKQGGLYLQSDCLQRIIFSYSQGELLLEEDILNQIVMVVKKRKLWPSFLRVCLLAQENCLPVLLSTLLADVMRNGGGIDIVESSESPKKDWVESAIRQIIKASDEKTIENVPEEVFENLKLSSFFRIFWFLHVISLWDIRHLISPPVRPISEPQKPASVSSVTLASTWPNIFAFLLDPGNIKILSGLSISMFLEVVFGYVINTEFVTNEEVAKGIIQRVEGVKAYWNKENMQREKDREFGLDDSTEGSSASPMSSSEDVSDSLKAPGDAFIIFKALLENLFQFVDQKYSPDVAFLGLKVLTLSIFRPFQEDIRLVVKLMAILLSSKFVGKRLWFHYEPISQEDYEEQIIRALINLKEDKIYVDTRIQLESLAKDNEFFRVYCFFLEETQGPVVAFKNYLDKVNYGTSSYLFNWLRKKLSNDLKVSRKFLTSELRFKHTGSFFRSHNFKFTLLDIKEQV